MVKEAKEVQVMGDIETDRQEQGKGESHDKYQLFDSQFHLPPLYSRTNRPTTFFDQFYVNCCLFSL